LVKLTFITIVQPPGKNPLAHTGKIQSCPTVKNPSEDHVSLSAKVAESEVFVWSRSRIRMNTRSRRLPTEVQLNHFSHRTPKSGILTRDFWNGKIFWNFYWSR